MHARNLLDSRSGCYLGHVLLDQASLAWHPTPVFPMVPASIISQDSLAASTNISTASWTDKIKAYLLPTNFESIFARATQNGAATIEEAEDWPQYANRLRYHWRPEAWCSIWRSGKRLSCSFSTAQASLGILCEVSRLRRQKHHTNESTNAQFQYHWITKVDDDPLENAKGGWFLIAEPKTSVILHLVSTLKQKQLTIQLSRATKISLTRTQGMKTISKVALGSCCVPSIVIHTPWPDSNSWELWCRWPIIIAASQSYLSRSTTLC